MDVQELSLCESGPNQIRFMHETEAISLVSAATLIAFQRCADALFASALTIQNQGSIVGAQRASNPASQASRAASAACLLIISAIFCPVFHLMASLKSIVDSKGHLFEEVAQD